MIAETWKLQLGNLPRSRAAHNSNFHKHPDASGDVPCAPFSHWCGWKLDFCMKEGLVSPGVSSPPKALVRVYILRLPLTVWGFCVSPYSADRFTCLQKRNESNVI